MFTIDQTSGVITLMNNLTSSIGIISQFLLTIRATDLGQPPRFALHTLTLIPITLPRFQSHVGVVSIDEGTALGTVVSELVCEEFGSSSNSLQIQLSSQPSELITLDGRSNLVIARQIDYEALSDVEREFNLSATCSNRFDQQDSLSITVIINNIDDNVFQFERPRYSFLVSENVTTQELVATLVASDQDMPNANITYSLATGSDFIILPHTGELLVQNSLDRETQSTYELDVRADFTNTTGLVERARAVVRIEVSDINDESPRFSQDLYDIRIPTEVESGDIVATVSAHDRDEGSNGEVHYQLVSGYPDFEINDTTGDIYVTSTSIINGLHVLNVTAIDGGEYSRSSSALVYIYIMPAFINRLFLTISENPVVIREDLPTGSLIGYINTTVLDSNNVTINGITVEFQLVNESLSAHFTINPTTGEIFTPGSIDYENSVREYHLTIGALLNTSNLVLYNETTVRIVVENVNDTPPHFSANSYVAVVEQFTLPNTTILAVSAHDPDGLDHIQYLLRGNGTSFQINSFTGEISASVELESPGEYRFTVIARDSGSEATASIYISVAAAPSFIAQDFTFSVPENSHPGTLVGEVTVSREGYLESLGEVRFRVAMSSSNNVTSHQSFDINSVSGNITTQAMFDAENQQQYVFYVEVYNNDTGTLYDVALVDIRIEDVNDNPPIFIEPYYNRAIYDSQEVNSVVLVLTATDRDSGNNSRIVYTFEHQEQVQGFALNSTSGEITISNSTLLLGEYNYSVLATDMGSPVLSTSTTVFIVILPTLPSTIEFTQPQYRFDVIEDSLPSTSIGVIQATYSNFSIVPQNISYLLPSQISDCFDIRAQNGEIWLTCTSLDRERINSYELEVAASAENLTTYAIVTIAVLDVNDNAPNFDLETYMKIINNTHSSADPILQLLATDSDHGDNGTVLYNILTETSIFTINSTSGEIFLLSEPIEIGDYRLLVEAVDMGTPISMNSTASVLIFVTRPHPRTLQFFNIHFNVTENAPLYSVIGLAALQTRDGDTVNPLNYPNDLQFSIVGGDSPNLFQINESTGLLTLNGPLDRETAPAHVIQIRANFTRFSNLPSITAPFVVNLLDVNDNVPSILLTNYASRISDNVLTGQILFNITATDNDLRSNSVLSFSVDSSSIFAVRTIGSNVPFT